MGRCFSMCAVIDRNAYIGCENKKWSAFARRSDHHTSQNELHPSGSPHKADRDRDPLVEIALAASGHQPLALETRARTLRGKSNVNTLAVMPLVACATPSTAHRALCSRSR